MNVYNSSVTHSQPTVLSHGASESPLRNDTLHQPEHVSLEWTLSLGVFMSLVVFVILLGNSLIIASVARFRRLHTQPNYFIASLACADLLMGLIVVPFGATLIVSGTWTWYFGETFCGFWTALDVMCVTASIHTLCAIAVDRYIAVTRPLRYETLMNKRRARIIIVSVWVVSALISFLPMQMGWWKESSRKATGLMQEHHPNNGSGNGSMTCEFDITPGYAIVSSAVSFYLPMFVMIFVYSKVFREAQKQREKIDRCEVRSNHQHHQHHHHHHHEHNNHQQQQQMDNGTGQPGYTSPIERRRPTGSSGGKKLSQILSRKDHKALKTMGLIMGTFTLCWLPFFVVNIVQVYCSCVPRGLFVMLNWLGYANSAFNPIIYCRSPELRVAMKRLLCFWRSRSSASGGRVTRRPLSCGTSDGGFVSSPGWTSSKRTSQQPETLSSQGFLLDEGGGGGSCVVTTPCGVSCEDEGTAKVTTAPTISNNTAANTAATTTDGGGGGGGGGQEAPHGDNGVLDANGNAHSCQ
ncbi:unnamed protein product [Lampetra planeri]